MRSFDIERMREDRFYVLSFLDDEEFRDREDEQRRVIRLNVLGDEEFRYREDERRRVLRLNVFG